MKRVLAFSLLVALAVAPAAFAKMGITLGLSDGTPVVGQTIQVILVTERPLTEFELQYGLQVVAVAPDASCRARLRSGSIDTLNRCERTRMYEVISKIVEGWRVSRSKGWSVSLTQTAPTTRTGTVRFPKPGRWLLVVPNGPTVGYSIPPPVVRAVPVTR